MSNTFLLLTNDEVNDAPLWALRDEVKRLNAEITRLHELQAAEQKRALDLPKCPRCQVEKKILYRCPHCQSLESASQ